jgi:hypothetical protein
LWRLLNINLFITSAIPLKSIFSLFWLYIWDHYISSIFWDNDSLNMGPYMPLIFPSSFYGIDAGLHALSLLWRHEHYLFSVFRGILPAIFGRFSKKLSTSAVVHQNNILPDNQNK